MANEKNHYHFVGIGGIGMSALAEWLLKEGYTVSGSDLNTSPIVSRLMSLGASVTKGHLAEVVREGSEVVFSSDIPEGNVELEAAKKLGCKTFHRSELAKKLIGTSPLLAVTGAHGKTSTSAVLIEVLEKAGLSPSFLIGGISRHFGVNGRRGEGKWVVLEADESDGSFLKCAPLGAIVTNFDREHLKYWKTEKALLDGFEQFAVQVEESELFFYCGDDPKLKAIYKRGVSYGFLDHNDLKISNLEQREWELSFDLSFEGRDYQKIVLKHIGNHQALNAAAVFGLALRLNIPEEVIRNALRNFSGVKRRLEVKGEVGHVLYLDDYGHHPTEIATTLKGLKKAFPLNRLVVAFQPHRYSRTEDSLALFGKAFEAADRLLMTDIYSAGEAVRPGINAEAIKREIEKKSTLPIELVSREKLASRVEEVVQPFDICLSIGAGDITHLFQEIKPPIKKLKIGVLFGGESVEHEVSIRSAAHVIEGCSFEPFEPVLFGIDREGNWYGDEEAKSVLKDEPLPSKKRRISEETLNSLSELDIVFPVFHGTNGEDGRIQGMFELLGIPFVGPPSIGCQLAMDKDLTKLLSKREGVPVAPYAVFTRNFREEIPPFPVWVKPVHLGSSIAIQRVKDQEELEEAVEYAFLFDDKLIIEQEIKGRELEFLVVGNEEVRAFPPGEILSNGAFYSYDAKYAPGGFGVDPAVKLPDKTLQEGMRFAKMAYEAIGCRGFSRVDFFLDQEGQFWLNEINPIPGFTSISLAPKIAYVNGFPIQSLVKWLALLGLKEHRHRQRLKKRP